MDRDEVQRARPFVGPHRLSRAGACLHLVDPEGRSQPRQAHPASRRQLRTPTKPNRKTTTMANQEFTLVLRGPIDDEIVAALFEAGSDDATIRTNAELVFAA